VLSVPRLLRKPGQPGERSMVKMAGRGKVMDLNVKTALQKERAKVAKTRGSNTIKVPKSFRLPKVKKIC